MVGHAGCGIGAMTTASHIGRGGGSDNGGGGGGGGGTITAPTLSANSEDACISAARTL